jgi:nitrilase
MSLSPDTRALRLALWQGPSPAGNIKAGCDVLETAVRGAGAAGAVMLVAPEVWLPGYNQPDIAGQALEAAGDWEQRLAKVCATAGCGLCVGYAGRSGNGVLNAAVAIGADGAVLGRYDKIQLYGPREKAIYRPGDRYCIFDLAGQLAAILICYDIEFDAHVAALARRGVKVILVPTANMAPFTHVARVTVPAMAANHAVSIVYANYCGVEGDLTYVGGSLIAAADGSVVAQAGNGPALIIADLPMLDLAYLSTQAADYREIR